MSQELLTVDVICDLRQYSVDINDIGSIQLAWQAIGEKLEGQSVRPGQPLAANLPEGNLNLWVVNAHNVSQITSETTFRILDLLRSPKLLYPCNICGKYGPLRCIVCEQNGQGMRLCADHAHKIRGELKAYCQQHIPHCECRANCQDQATFRCRRCYKLFGNHYHHHHPNDTTVDYCHWCYRLLFERCETPGCHHLGRSKCAYQTRSMAESCQKPLCAEHSYQWKIWGPHNRGVTLCEQHKKLMGATDPADLLFMMFTAKAPYARRGRQHSLPNPFRLRRIINRNRVGSLTFDQISYALRSLEPEATKWGKRAESNYRYMSKNFIETTSGLTGIEANLLAQIKAFYQQRLGWDAAQQITRLEITDGYYQPGQPLRYRVQLYLSTSNKGTLIGRGGAIINELRRLLNLEIDM